MSAPSSAKDPDEDYRTSNNTITEANGSVPASPSLKKKKKKKPKKKFTSQTTALSTDANGSSPVPKSERGSSASPKVAAKNDTSVLRLARNKHWKYVSSFHGQWLTLPIEMLDSLFSSNAAPMPGIPIDSSQAASSAPFQHGASSPSPSARKRRTQLDPRRNFAARAGTSSGTLPLKADGTVTLAIPPPIDPGVFKCLREIRRLVDEAADLALRAASGLVAPGSRSPLDSSLYSGQGYSDVGSYQDTNLSGYGGGYHGSSTTPGNRQSTLTTLRANRMRVQAVGKLAEAYKLDEVATSVMIMKGTSALEDLAERVLRHDPNSLDAKYVHFFHTKVPSSPRQLCETTTEQLDYLIAARPSNLEYYRTRGVVECFLEQYDLAIRDFTHALTQARQTRRAAKKDRELHDPQDEEEFSPPADTASNGLSGIRKDNPINIGVDAESPNHPSSQPSKLHHSLSPNAPDPFESQLLFARASAYLAHVISTIEKAVFGVEGVPNPEPSSPEIRLSTLDIPPHPSMRGNGTEWKKPKFGGVSYANLLGLRNTPLVAGQSKWQAYRSALYENVQLRELVFTMLRKSIRDFERFLTHFDSIIVPDGANPPPGSSQVPSGGGPPMPSSLSIPLTMMPNGALRPTLSFSTSSPGSKLKGSGGGKSNAATGKGKEVALNPLTNGTGYYQGTSSTSIQIPAGALDGLLGDDGESQTINLKVNIRGQVRDGKALGPLPGKESKSDSPGRVNNPTSLAIASALQAQLGKSGLASAILEQLPAAAAKAIEDAAGLGNVDAQTISEAVAQVGIPLSSVSASSGLSMNMKNMSLNGKDLVPTKKNRVSGRSVYAKWSDAPLVSRVAFSFFVTDCLRATPSSGTLTTATTLVPHDNPSASNTTTTTTTTVNTAPGVLPGGVIPTSPAPELEPIFPVSLTTYHPLLIDAHFSILLAQLLLGDIPALLETFVKAAVTVEGADGFPVFHPARSIAQADFNEILERMCEAWSHGKAKKPTNGSSRMAEGSGSRSSHGSGPRPGEGSSSSSTRRHPPSSSISDDESDQPVESNEALQGLQAMRVLLGPVYNRLMQKRQVAQTRGASSIPLVLLHSPRVDVALAWLAAVHLPAWEDASY